MTGAAANVHLDGKGNLDIVPLRTGSAWTSGRIQTSSQFAPPAGGEMMITAAIKQPDPANATGYWPGFWLLGPGQWPEHGEIDILEDVNSSTFMSGTLHCGNLYQRNPDGSTGPCHESAGLGSGLRPCPSCQTSYHTYAVVIDRRNTSNEQVRWYLDGHEYYSVSESTVGAAAWSEAIDHGFIIIFDLAIGGSYPNSQCQCSAPNAQTSPGAAMSIRDVAVYDLQGH